MENEKDKIEFLDIVIPFAFIYTSVICFKICFIDNIPKGTLWDMILLTCLSFVFMYGLIYLIRDLRWFGINYVYKVVLKGWRWIYKKKSK